MFSFLTRKGNQVYKKITNIENLQMFQLYTPPEKCQEYSENHKSQAPNDKQNTIYKTQITNCLEIGIWNLFGIWNL